MADDHSHHDHDHGHTEGHAHGEHARTRDSHAGHSHGHDHGAVNRSRLGWAALLTAAFMIIEIAGGLWSGSLALLADAGHMFTDCAALALAWFAARLATRPADWKRTYGFDRFSVLVAFVNGLALFVIAAVIVVEAIDRLNTPHPVAGLSMLVIAVAGLLVNIGAFLILHGADRNNLNIRSAALHVLGDLLGSAAAIVAALVIITTGWMPIDPTLSVLVALLILRSGWQVVRDAGHILLEGAPEELDNRAVAADLVKHVPGVHDVHHVHAWSISEERKMVTLHAGIEPTEPPDRAIRAIKARLAQVFGVDHVTVEIEIEDCADNGRGSLGHRRGANAGPSAA